METEFQKEVFRVCSKIPRGKVSTYSQIAKALHRYGASRAVGNALNKNRSSTVPCHRVVCSNGSIGGFAHGSEKKIAMLRAEGLTVKDGFIEDFDKVLKRF